MKVFEVMSLLAECPAGSEVKVRNLMTVEELIKNDALDIEGEINYQVDKCPDSVESITDDLTVIYL